jgi:hypothetical protein
MGNVTVVYKYPIHDLRGTVSLPAGAKPLAVREQRGQACLWALVDPTKPPVERRVYILGTGHDQALDGFDYVDTFMMHDGAFVFHVFVEREQ